MGETAASYQLTTYAGNYDTPPPPEKNEQK